MRRRTTAQNGAVAWEPSRRCAAAASCSTKGRGLAVTGWSWRTEVADEDREPRLDQCSPQQHGRLGPPHGPRALGQALADAPWAAWDGWRLALLEGRRRELPWRGELRVPCQ
ncbi:hypothetical protein HYH03_000409 [Edaphochlamys debaryana]|uniref:Uncharacterized protein n=1 Tax=Edaphochlamys debaryana TaxID=47281 RepID=A0A836C7M0_9CHLO|nr:hypothetical protein HYH03_000409 [Edaphochlamys debaryana]|eukprot:KAG2501912.1 hypothetical protein HYH03_000409 [Edaphochlamys debaryana]